MNWRCVLLLCLLPQLAVAGHGLMNAFAGIPWLPAPGFAPDSPWYPLQRWGEQSRLALTGTASARLSYALARARVHLATAEAMATQGKADALLLALEAWRSHLETAIAAADTLPVADRRALLNALLEQQYIASTDYLDLPRSARRPVRDTLQDLSRRYAEVAAALPREARGDLFFREEEVRWSLSLAVAADEQGL